MKRFQIEVSGTVTDHLTGQFVNGASVFTSLQKSNLYGDSLISPVFRTASGSDGNFIFHIEAVSGYTPIGLRAYVIAIKAVKSGYTNGNRVEIAYINGKNMTVNLELIK